MSFHLLVVTFEENVVLKDNYREQRSGLSEAIASPPPVEEDLGGG